MAGMNIGGCLYTVALGARGPVGSVLTLASLGSPLLPTEEAEDKGAVSAVPLLQPLRPPGKHLSLLLFPSGVRWLNGEGIGLVI